MFGLISSVTKLAEVHLTHFCNAISLCYTKEIGGVVWNLADILDRYFHKHFWNILTDIKIQLNLNFPDGPLAKTTFSQCRGPRG